MQAVRFTLAAKGYWSGHLDADASGSNSVL